MPTNLQPVLQPVFSALRTILEKYQNAWHVEQVPAESYTLAGTPGPATLRAWNGKLKQPSIPIAWVQLGKSYVSYHLMGVYGNANLLNRMSNELKARMQGKTCFNFKAIDETLFRELEEITAHSITAFQKSGYVI